MLTRVFDSSINTANQNARIFNMHVNRKVIQAHYKKMYSSAITRPDNTSTSKQIHNQTELPEGAVHWLPSILGFIPPV